MTPLEVLIKPIKEDAREIGDGFKLNTPDAIQIATGLLNGAEIFLTNDTNLKQVQEVEVVVLLSVH